MKFPRSRKLTFINNKGGVGKTTLSFNIAAEFAKKGYKTVLVDLDPQANLTRLTLGENEAEKSLFYENKKTIFDVMRGILKGGADIDISVKFMKTQIENLFILPGDLRLSEYEHMLGSGPMMQATTGQEKGLRDTSAINRFLEEKGAREEIDIFVIDTSPSLGMLNKIILLGSDYFVVPVEPDPFSIMGVETLGDNLAKWRDEWRNSAKALSRLNKIPSDLVLEGEPLFIGYILNNFRPGKSKNENKRGEMMFKQQNWFDQIPQKVKSFLSEKHSKNGLVEHSHLSPLGKFREFGSLNNSSQIANIPITELGAKDAGEINLKGSKDIHDDLKIEFPDTAQRILAILEKYK